MWAACVVCGCGSVTLTVCVELAAWCAWGELPNTGEKKNHRRAPDQPSNRTGGAAGARRARAARTGHRAAGPKIRLTLIFTTTDNQDEEAKGLSPFDEASSTPNSLA